MNLKSMLNWVAVTLLLLGWSACGLAQTPRPTIRVGLGMTIAQLRAGSTYPFKEDAPTFQMGPGIKVKGPSSPGLQYWIITRPYDLTLVYKGHEFKQDDLGGDNYLIAITTDPTTRQVDTLGITFQNRGLTLDEALAEATRLQDWFVHVGFHLPPLTAKEMAKVKEYFVGPFFVGEQEWHAPRYVQKVSSYADVRKAFLDTRSKIIEITPFQLVTDDAIVTLRITNARRKREAYSHDRDESHVMTEQEYFLELDIFPRPWNRYAAKCRMKGAC